MFKATRGGEVRALKVMHPDLSRDPTFVERFKAEILTLAGLRGHKHLVEIHGFGKDADCWYFLMEFIDGLSLEQYLLKKGPLPLAQAIPYSRGRPQAWRWRTAEVSSTATSSRPTSCFGSRTGSPSWWTSAWRRWPRLGLDENRPIGRLHSDVRGPGAAAGKPADARSDVYSLAASLFYALNYDKPHLREPDKFEPEYAPETLCEVLTGALHPKPERRYANAGELSAALEKPAAPPPPQPAKQRRRPGDLYTNSLGMKFAWIPPGTFLMGSSPKTAWDADDIQHRATLTKGFWMGVHQVTQAQWRAMMGTSPSHFRGDDLPVEQITWDAAVAFCEALGRKDGKTYRLPTEAEWEYACRAGTTTEYSFGEDRKKLDDYAWYADNSGGRNPRSGDAEGESVGFVRHARQRLGMVPRLVRPVLFKRCNGSSRW